MSSALRVAVVGGGWVSTNRHLPALRSHPQVEVAGLVASPDLIDRLDRSAAYPAVATDLDASWVRDVDAVMIGTPPTTHRDLVCQALELGKHVLVEKPMAMNPAEAAEMLATAERAGRVLAVVHNLQFGRAATRAKRALSAGHIGELRGVVGAQSSNHRRRLPTWYQSLPLGLFTDESPHLIYLARSFLGDVSVEHAQVGPPLSPADHTPDLVALHLRSATGTPGSLLMAFMGALSEWHLVLVGSQGTLVMDFFRDICLSIPDDGGHRTAEVLRTSASAVVGHVAGVVGSGGLRIARRLDYGNGEVVRRFVAAVCTGSTPLGMTGADGAAVVEIMDAANAAAGLR